MGSPPVNESERAAVDYLRHELPDTFVIFPNLTIETRPHYRPDEFDLVIVGPYAVYTVEVKGWGGRIRGNAYEWRLESGDYYRSPLRRNDERAKGLSSLLARQRVLPKVYVDSVLILTDPRVSVELRDDQAYRVMGLPEAAAYLRDHRQIRLPAGAPRVSIEPYRKLICGILEAQFRPLERIDRIKEFRLLPEKIAETPLYTIHLAVSEALETKPRYWLKVYETDCYADRDQRARQHRQNQRDALALHAMPPHENIVRVSPPINWQDTKYVVPLEYVPGFSLRGLLEDDSIAATEIGRRLEIARQLGAALRHAHRHGVVHRDVRPENVWVRPDGRVVLVNFDAAQVEGVGTIAPSLVQRLDRRYAAPEVWTDPKQASPASDQYAFGTILLELLAGRSLDGAPADLSTWEMDPRVPAGARELVLTMRAPRPSERYPTLDEALLVLDLLA